MKNISKDHLQLLSHLKLFESIEKHTELLKEDTLEDEIKYEKMCLNLHKNETGYETYHWSEITKEMMFEMDLLREYDPFTNTQTFFLDYGITGVSIYTIDGVKKYNTILCIYKDKMERMGSIMMTTIIKNKLNISNIYLYFDHFIPHMYTTFINTNCDFIKVHKIKS